MDESKNATCLFRAPYPEFHHHEAWWSAFFSMLVVFLAKEGSEASIPVYECCADGYLDQAGVFSISGLTGRSIVADGKLCGVPFGITDWPGHFADLRPDISIIDEAERTAAFIEVKAVGSSLARNVELYDRILAYLRENGWAKVDLYYLLSHGHETSPDWRLLSKQKRQIMVWEDVLRLSIGTPFEHFPAEPVGEYATHPQRRELSE